MRVQYIYSVQQNKVYARWILRANRARAVQPFGMVQITTEHVSDAYSTVSTHLCLHFILKNHAKSKLDSNIVANLWVIDANYKSQLIEICTKYTRSNRRLL